MSHEPCAAQRATAPSARSGGGDLTSSRQGHIIRAVIFIIYALRRQPLSDDSRGPVTQERSIFLLQSSVPQECSHRKLYS
jgi:hypothetical protein